MHWPLAWTKAPPALFPIPASMPFTSWQIDEENVETGSDFLVLGSKITADGDCSHKSKRRLLLGRKAMTKLDSVLKSRDITLPTKVCIVKAMFSPVVMYGCWGLDYKKRLNLQKTFESPLDCKEIKPINPTGNQYQIFIARTGAKVEAPIFWPPDAKSWLTGRDPDAGKDWGQEGTIEDEMVQCHHWLNGHELEQALGETEGQESRGCCSPWGHKELVTKHDLAIKQHPGSICTMRGFTHMCENLPESWVLSSAPADASPWLPLWLRSVHNSGLVCLQEGGPKEEVTGFCKILKTSWSGYARILGA